MYTCQPPSPSYFFSVKTSRRIGTLFCPQGNVAGSLLFLFFWSSNS